MKKNKTNYVLHATYNCVLKHGQEKISQMKSVNMEIINQREEKVKLENQALHRMLLNSVETLSTNKEWKLDSYKK